MQYKVTIEEISTITSVEQEWKVVKTTYPDLKEMENKGYSKFDFSGTREHESAFKDVKLESIYGYVDLPSTKTTKVTLLEQTVYELDIAAVIKAINKL